MAILELVRIRARIGPNRVAMSSDRRMPVNKNASSRQMEVDETGKEKLKRKRQIRNDKHRTRYKCEHNFRRDFEPVELAVSFLEYCKPTVHRVHLRASFLLVVSRMFTTLKRNC